MVKPSDNDLRKFRDKIYGYQRDESWQSCKGHWAEDGQWQWLVEQYAKIIAAEARL